MVSLLRLRLSMIGTLTVLILVSTLFFAGVLTLIGSFNLLTVVSLAVGFNLLQWLIAPYIIKILYGVRQVSRTDEPRLYEIVEQLSRKLRIKPPQIGISSLSIPNAFAYGSLISGSRVAVTSGLLQKLDDGEVEAVLGHELGHLKNRDVQIMMFASVLPAIFYYLGYSFLYSGGFGGRRRDTSGTTLVAIASIAIYWILSLFVLHLSRIREYLADRTSAMTVDDGAGKLSQALVKITGSTARSSHGSHSMGAVGTFKTLFITDPANARSEAASLAAAGSDETLVQDLLSQKLGRAQRIMELFSSHPNVVNRLRALRSIQERRT